MPGIDSSKHRKLIKLIIRSIVVQIIVASLAIFLGIHICVSFFLYVPLLDETSNKLFVNLFVVQNNV